METLLINLLVYVSTLLVAGLIIYIISLFPIHRTFKIIITFISLAAFAYWCVNTFETYNSLKIWITNLINNLSS